VNLKALKNNLTNIIGFNDDLLSNNYTIQFQQPTFAIGGRKSNYIRFVLNNWKWFYFFIIWRVFIFINKITIYRESDHKMFHKLFATIEYEQIDNAGHWVHAEQPQMFIDSIVKFIQKFDE
jgi:pimeloyl-ACP methyl ester carboxylesterase